jgi:microcystin degradation protein MlrC
MRFFVSGFQHETNSFAQSRADWQAFEKGDFFPPFSRGKAMLELHRTGGLPVSGFLAQAQAHGHEIVPSCWAGASPSGPVTQDAFGKICAVILEDLAQAMHTSALSGIYLDLHGAAVSADCESLETELVRRIRGSTGPAMPIVLSLDLHANVTDELLDLADGAVAYRTYPHVDMEQTGVRAFRLLEQRIAHGGRKFLARRRIPFLIPIVAQATSTEPAAGVYALLAQLEEKGVVTASFATGFPATDVPHCGPCVWAYGADSQDVVDRIYDRVVGARSDWAREIHDADQAVSLALELSQDAVLPVVIADPQDNPGAGTDSNTTGLLHALVAQGAGRRWPHRVALGLLNDPQAADAAWRAGVGTVIRIRVGRSVKGHDGQWSALPLHGDFRVTALHEGKVRLKGPMMTGTLVQPGRCACLELGGILVAVSSEKTQMLDRELYEMLQIHPHQMKLIVNKSAVHFRADFESIASHILIAKSPGPMAVDPGDLPWHKLRVSVATRP